jgi:signal transduction histidine kinase
MWGSKVATQLTPSNVMLGRTRWEVSPARNDSEAQMWADHIAKLQAREPFYEFEYPTAQPDGSRRWVSISGVPIFGPDGEFQGYRGRVTDIEDRKKKEAELLAAKQAADAANRAKSEFLATMSHEIRTPMNGIVGLTALALEGPLSADQREHLSAVQQSADGLLAIINDILDLSKIEAGQMQLEATPFDLPEVLSGVLKVVSFNARAKGVELSLDIAADVPRHVIGDPTRVRQVVLNLVGNAIKFTAHGAVTVRARLAQQGPPGMTLRFEV